jgi:hypothetical protein
MAARMAMQKGLEFATDLLEDGHDIRTIEELPGHNDARTTAIDTHVLNRGGKGVRGPVDRLCWKRPRTIGQTIEGLEQVVK